MEERRVLVFGFLYYIMGVRSHDVTSLTIFKLPPRLENGGPFYSSDFRAWFREVSPRCETYFNIFAILGDIGFDRV